MPFPDPRVDLGHECDHSLPVVSIDGLWYHITGEGSIGSVCSTGIYEVRVVRSGDHDSADLIRPDRTGEPMTEPVTYGDPPA